MHKKKLLTFCFHLITILKLNSRETGKDRYTHTHTHKHTHTHAWRLRENKCWVQV